MVDVRCRPGPVRVVAGRARSAFAAGRARFPVRAAAAPAAVADVIPTPSAWLLPALPAGCAAPPGWFAAPATAIRARSASRLAARISRSSARSSTVVVRWYASE
ncbi:hypothetical protein GCM10010532_004670 [Dactylosporangium siamense]|uniref:Uncharacterized protein n=1 Tax=Dactylosporangium siamense TaxID=685454 RepID=A0A919PSH2_9ACTN|nr:hypothetical protein Dsi01nite_073900 [Dactylosporangium siamense]